jgi:hypothetical protein
MAKDGPFILSVDAGSNHMGLALWQGDVFVRSGALHSAKASDAYTKRLKDMKGAFDIWLGGACVNTVVTEALKLPLVVIPLGLIFLHPNVNCAFSNHHQVHPGTWKKWAKEHGATGPHKLVKGVKSLLETGWPHPVTSDDEADAILVALYYFEHRWK